MKQPKTKQELLKLFKIPVSEQTPEQLKRIEELNKEIGVVKTEDWRIKLRIVKIKSAKIGGVVINEDLLNELISRLLNQQAKDIIREIEKMKKKPDIKTNWGFTATMGNTAYYNECLQDILTILKQKYET